ASPFVLKWDNADDDALVLGVRDENGKCIATMRAETIHNAEKLRTKLDYDIPEGFVEFPVGVLGKAATDPEHRGLGLNTLLRYLSFAIFSARGIRHVVGTVMPNAPRIDLMRALGCEFFENENGWYRYGYKSNGATLVARLDLKAHAEKI